MISPGTSRLTLEEKAAPLSFPINDRVPDEIVCGATLNAVASSEAKAEEFTRLIENKPKSRAMATLHILARGRSSRVGLVMIFLSQSRSF